MPKRNQPTSEPTSERLSVRLSGPVGAAKASPRIELTDADLNAIARQLLAVQCERFGLPLERLPLDARGIPEAIALGHFRSLGYQGAACEGGPFLLLIKAMCFPALARHNHFGSREEDACTRFVEAQFTLLSRQTGVLFEAAEKTTEKSLLRAFREIYAHPFVRDAYPGVTEDVIVGLFGGLGFDARSALVRAFAEAPYDYRAGWPDLTLIGGGKIRLVEVKTSDKLHLSQLRILRRFRPILPVEFSVIQLIGATNGGIDVDH